MFAQNLFYSRIEYCGTAIDLNNKIERSDSTNIQSSTPRSGGITAKRRPA
ncbi:hypothetical protein D1AOALGA4SA_8311 [Olavius algarvensis Delta 1 endosymbiont]|nr:hypothetical protein D1AOALGA4SA_8311 [Olavius algarvensis Delta 1 endosymbiont]